MYNAVESCHEAHPLEMAAKETVTGKVREARARSHASGCPADPQYRPFSFVGRFSLHSERPTENSLGLTHSSQAQGL